MAYLLVIFDGAADCPTPELQEKTSLEIAKTTNLDWIADHGRSCSTYIYELPVELGLAKLLGMDYVKVPVNSCGNADYIRLAEVIFCEMNKYDLVVCHVKGPYEPGHDGDWKAKLDILEKIDHLLISPIRTSFDFSKGIIIVTSDHATPWSMGTQTADKVPVIIAGKNISPDKVQSFSEKACLPGGMGLYYAHQIIPYIMEVERL